VNSGTELGQAAEAIAHVLRQIRDYPEVGWYLGDCTQSFHLLTEAHAAITKQSVEKVRELFLPRKPFDPRAKGAEEAADANASRMSAETCEDLASDIAGDIMLENERPRITRLCGMDVDGNVHVEWMRRDIEDRIARRLTGNGGAA
jgi:hypothetical protein